MLFSYIYCFGIRSSINFQCKVLCCELTWKLYGKLCLKKKTFFYIYIICCINTDVIIFFAIYRAIVAFVLTLWLMKPEYSGTISLTHWGLDNMATIYQMTFSDASSWMKMCKFQSRFHGSLLTRVQLKYSSIGSDNGLVPFRRQAIIWTSSDYFTDAYMRHSASMG